MNKKTNHTDSKIMSFLKPRSLLSLQETSKVHYSIVNNDEGARKKISDHKLSRANTIANESAINTYKAINKNWKYLSNNKKLTSTVPEPWKIEIAKINNNQIEQILVWDNTSGIELSVAIEKIIEHPMIVECTAAAMITRLAIICAVLGKERTKVWISNMTKNGALKIDYALMPKLSWRFFKKTDKPQKDEIFAVPFVNIPEYSQFKPNGPDSNFNAIGLSDGNYTSFGSIFEGENATYEEFEDFLFEKFINNEYIEPKLEKDHREFVKELTKEGFSRKRLTYQEKIGYFSLNLSDLANFK